MHWHMVMHVQKVLLNDIKIYISPGPSFGQYYTLSYKPHQV